MSCALLLAGCGKDDGSLRMVTEASFPPYEFLRGREVVGVEIVQKVMLLVEECAMTVADDNGDAEAFCPRFPSLCRTRRRRWS